MTRALVVPLLLFAATTTHAQTVPFGKNKIQYENFDWRILSGEHIDLYYYPEEEEVARRALVYAEEDCALLEQRFRHHPFRRIPLIVYSSDRHFEQTNVLPGFIPEGVLGFTEYLKRRVALPFRGDYEQFRQTLRHELVHAFQLSKLSEAQRLYPRERGESPQYIHWWTEGLAEFWSSEQSTEDDMYIRDIVLTGNLPTIHEFNRTYSFFSYPLGAELHHYLADRFGDQYIARMYEEYRRHDSFEQALQSILGIDLDRLTREWQYSLEQRFYPQYADRPPLDVAGERLVWEGGANFKPVVWRDPGTAVDWLIFMSPRNGYTNMYRTRLDRGEDGVETVLEGERSPEFESLNAWESGFDVNDDGVVALVSSFLDRDALVLWSLEENRLVGRYQWDDLVGLKSPAWDPAGRSVVFEGISTAGFSDLYTFDFDTQRRTALTHDLYRDADPDWSPDGRSIVFTSDRTANGENGSTNLVIHDVESGRLRYLTWGPWQDRGPRWSPDGSRIAFTSDRDGHFDLWEVAPDGHGRRLTRMTGGAFDAEWLPDGRSVVFSGFHDRAFAIYRARVPSDTAVMTRIALDPRAPAAIATNGDNGSDNRIPEAEAVASNGPWTWPGGSAEMAGFGPAIAYESFGRFTLDFAAADAIVAPGVGSAQGGQFLLTDMLGDHVIFGGLSAAQFGSFSSLVDNVSASLLYLNLKNRLNYGVGAFRFKGRFRDVDLDVYDEATWGSYFLASYPLSKFRRVEFQLGLEKSRRTDLEDAFEDGIFGRTTRPDPRDLTRDGILSTNYVSFVKDNTLWLPTGPIDGNRYNFTAGLTSCFSCTTPSPITGQPVERSAVGESFSLYGDVRRYFRTSLQSAYAIRGFAFYSGGAIPGRWVLGGTNWLRGYPRWSLAGSRVWLVNQEWRFPLLDGLSLAFPFGTVRLPGVQGAFFADIGSSWLESQSRAEGSWGSYGVGFRSSLGAPLVLRLDIGRRFKVGDPPPVIFPGGSRFNDTFVDFFFGFNY
ncbi:MAG TPA: hypothetical protein VMM79_16865 [Longimicrobiales bacterium]|nr:hypothetical protein [Longimicrobiales bacterium]